MRPARDLASRWVPVVLWAGVIWLFSTEWFGGSGTRGVLVRVLGVLLPMVSAETLEWLHQVARKLAHVTEFAILALLLGRAVLREGRSVGALAVRVLPAAVAWAALDEFHQTFVPGRVGAVSDVLLDSAGVLLGFAAFLALRPWLSDTGS